MMSDTEEATELARLLPRFCKFLERHVSLTLCSSKALYLCLSTPGFANQQRSIWHERHLSSAWQISGGNDEMQHLYT